MHLSNVRLKHKLAVLTCQSAAQAAKPTTEPSSTFSSPA